MAEAVSIRELEQSALAYLKEQLGTRAPDYIALEAEFDESLLDGEGRTLLFSFPLAPGPGIAAADCAESYDPRHYVAVGETKPNYFPAYGLSADDAYSFHVGTRYMLEMQVQRVDDSLEPPGARDILHRTVEQLAPNALIENEQLAVLFKCDADYYAVYRLSVGGQDVYSFGADCPPGFYRLTQHPPQTALRLHLGKLIRDEARRERDRA